MGSVVRRFAVNAATSLWCPIGLLIDAGATEQAAPSLACTTIELPDGVRIRVRVATDRQPGQRVEDRT